MPQAGQAPAIPTLPYPANSGGKQYPYFLVRNLSKQFEVHFIYQENQEITDEDRKHFGQFCTLHAVPVEKKSFIRKLIDIFKKEKTPGEPAGLWINKDNPDVFKVNGKGLDCFIEREKKDNPKYKAGSAKPPWSWDDNNDRHTAGELALQPAHIVYNYFSGLREFSLEYKRNPYWGK